MLLEELRIHEGGKMDMLVDGKSSVDIANHRISHGISDNSFIQQSIESVME